MSFNDIQKDSEIQKKLFNFKWNIPIKTSDKYIIYSKKTYNQKFSKVFLLNRKEVMS